MFLSVLLKSFSQTARKNGRRKVTESVARTLEVVESRCLLSSVGLARFWGGGTGKADGGPAATNPLTSIPRLESFPGAPVTVYLDFDGHTENQDWPSVRTDGQNGAIVTPVFDVDNDFTTFSDEELRMIEEVWYRVAEDFAPFNVNVTTIDPGSYNNFETILVSIGGNGSWIGRPGGVAFIGAFNNSASNTSYVFTDNLGVGSPNHMKNVADATSHEVGHTLGLNHHALFDANGNMTNPYDPGRPDLGPIMGAPYGSMRTIWVNAPSNVNVTTFQDDLAIITGPVNRTIRYRADDHGDSIAQATPIVVTSPDISASGIIGRNGDSDFFRVTTDAGSVSFSVSGLNLRTIYGRGNLNFGTNLNAFLRLYNSNGQLISTAAMGNTPTATISTSVAQGTYFVEVAHNGNYGEIGQYTLTGTVIPLPDIPTMVSPTGTISQTRPVFRWTQSGNAVSYELQVDNITTGVSGVFTTTVSTTNVTPPAPFGEGTYRSRVRSLGTNGTFSDWSSYLQFTISIPAPAAPSIIRPKGLIAEAFPNFEWTQVAFGTRYELLVQNRVTNERVIYRTGLGRTEYTHFSPLKNGSYDVSVRAANALNRFGAWSAPILLRVQLPVPPAPRLSAPVGVSTSVNPRFVWNEVNGAAYYELRVNNLSAGQANFIHVTEIPKDRTFYVPGKMPQGNYGAFVRAINGNGVAGPWSPRLNFTLDILPPVAPKLTGPRGENDSPTIITTTPTFSWDSALRAVRYELLVNNLTTRTAGFITRDDITDLSFTSVSRMPKGRYRVWVRGINEADEVGRWSAPLEFEINEPRPQFPQGYRGFIAPVLTTLGNVETANPTFIWDPIPGAATYEVQIYNTSLDRNVVTARGLTETNYTVPNQLRLGEFAYQARLRGVNASGDASVWTAWFAFRVNVPDPTTPILLSPGGTITQTRPTFTWRHSGSSFRYEILLRDLLRQEERVLQVQTFQLNPGQTTASYTLPAGQALRPGTYRFWVRAFNSLGQASAWSTSMTFVITVASADKPEKTESPVLPGEVLLTSMIESPGFREFSQSGKAVRVEQQREPNGMTSDGHGTDYETAGFALRVPDPRPQNSAGRNHLPDSEEVSLIDFLMREMADPRQAGLTTDPSV